MVIHGGIRDLVRVLELPDLAALLRGVDPTAIADVTLREQTSNPDAAIAVASGGQ